MNKKGSDQVHKLSYVETSGCREYYTFNPSLSKDFYMTVSEMIVVLTSAV